MSSKKTIGLVLAIVGLILVIIGALCIATYHVVNLEDVVNNTGIVLIAIGAVLILISILCIFSLDKSKAAKGQAGKTSAKAAPEKTGTTGAPVEAAPAEAGSGLAEAIDRGAALVVANLSAGKMDEEQAIASRGVLESYRSKVGTPEEEAATVEVAQIIGQLSKMTAPAKKEAVAQAASADEAKEESGLDKAIDRGAALVRANLSAGKMDEEQAIASRGVLESYRSQVGTPEEPAATIEVAQIIGQLSKMTAPAKKEPAKAAPAKADEAEGDPGLDKMIDRGAALVVANLSAGKMDEEQAIASRGVLESYRSKVGTPEEPAAAVEVAQIIGQLSKMTVPAKKKPVTKAPAKKTTAKKAPVKKEAVKKAPAKKEAVKKETVKKEAAKKAPVKKEAVKKEAAKKAPAKKTTANKAPAKPRKKAAKKKTAVKSYATSVRIGKPTMDGSDLAKAIKRGTIVLDQKVAAGKIDNAHADADFNFLKSYKPKIGTPEEPAATIEVAQFIGKLSKA